MSFYTYILFSKKGNKYYVGQTDNIETRLASHLSQKSRFTSVYDDWELKHFEEFETRKEAIQRENQIKKKKSRTYIEGLLVSN